MLTSSSNISFEDVSLISFNKSRTSVSSEFPVWVWKKRPDPNPWSQFTNTMRDAKNTEKTTYSHSELKSSSPRNKPPMFTAAETTLTRVGEAIVYMSSFASGGSSDCFACKEERTLKKRLAVRSRQQDEKIW